MGEKFADLAALNAARQKVYALPIEMAASELTGRGAQVVNLSLQLGDVARELSNLHENDKAERGVAFGLIVVMNKVGEIQRTLGPVVGGSTHGRAFEAMQSTGLLHNDVRASTCGYPGCEQPSS